MENSCETGPTGREADLSCSVDDIVHRAINSSCGKVVTCDVANQTTANANQKKVGLWSAFPLPD